MSLLRLYCLRYSRKLKSPLVPESMGLCDYTVSTPLWLSSVWFVARQRALIWEYWCRRGSLWPCCKQAVWMSWCLEGTSVIESGDGITASNRLADRGTKMTYEMKHWAGRDEFITVMYMSQNFRRQTWKVGVTIYKCMDVFLSPL